MEIINSADSFLARGQTGFFLGIQTSVEDHDFLLIFFFILKKNLGALYADII